MDDRHVLHEAGGCCRHRGARVVVQERMESLDMITNEEKLKCVKRELAMRRNAYPKWEASNRMKIEQADHEITVMEAVVKDYEKLVKP